MSQAIAVNEIDLIDFDIKSPIFSRACTSFISNTETSDNLLDTELPVLEQKLQATDNFPSTFTDLQPSVDIEDILISLDDEEDYVSKAKASVEPQENVLENNIEILDVLNNLDEVLNACLKESDLTLYNKSNLESNEISDNHSIDDNNHILDFSSRSSSPVSDDTKIIYNTDVSEIRTKLRHYEENYNKFLTSGYVNRGYINTESNERIRRPLSACDLYNQSENIDFPKHATIGVVKKKRTPLYQNNGEYIDFTYNVQRPCRTTADSSEDIDWSWLEDVARDISSERIESDYPSRNSDEENSVPPETVNPQYDNHAITAIRLRDSMRRLDPLLLPPSIDTSLHDVHTLTSSVEATNSVLQAESCNQQRFISSLNTNASRSGNARPSRSRSCESRAVGRARSSFSSTRSRRPRSLSSSLSTVSSSAESSPSFNPSASPLENNPTTDTPITPAASSVRA